MAAIEYNMPHEEEETTTEQSKYITIVASDGHYIRLEREMAHVSGTIKAMLSGEGVCGEGNDEEYYDSDEEDAESEEEQEEEDDCIEIEEKEIDITFREIPSHTLMKVCDYLRYKKKYDGTSEIIPHFPINVHESMELLMAANFMDC